MLKQIFLVAAFFNLAFCASAQSSPDNGPDVPALMVALLFDDACLVHGQTPQDLLDWVSAYKLHLKPKTLDGGKEILLISPDGLTGIAAHVGGGCFVAKKDIDAKDAGRYLNARLHDKGGLIGPLPKEPLLGTGPGDAGETLFLKGNRWLIGIYVMKRPNDPTAHPQTTLMATLIPKR